MTLTDIAFGGQIVAMGDNDYNNIAIQVLPGLPTSWKLNFNVWIERRKDDWRKVDSKEMEFPPEIVGFGYHEVVALAEDWLEELTNTDTEEE